MMPAVTETFTCASCGGTFDKGWSDEEAATEAEEFFPGINVTDPAEAGVVCDGCYQHIMGRARAEAPELIGEGWRGQAPEPIPDFPGLIAWLTASGYALNPCTDGCQDKGAEHAHLRSPSGDDGIIWADGRVSEWDLTLPARLIYPAAGRTAYARASLPGSCYQTGGGLMVHVRPGCRCK
jgi:hypothetical protein